MGKETGISWTDATWNCMRGCSRTAPAGSSQSGCGDPTGGGCYAERNGYRFAGPGLAYEGLVRMTPNGARWTGMVLLVDEHLLDPIRWTKPRHIFTTSVSDPFHERFTNDAIAVVVGVMALSRWHTHQMLTKRSRRMREWFGWVEEQALKNGITPAAFCIWRLREYVVDNPREVFTERDRQLVVDATDSAGAIAWPLPNLWPMVSVENQAAADERIPELLAVPAAVHGLSCEPLLGAVDVSPWLRVLPLSKHRAAVAWVIVGCESGPGARACDVEHIRSLRDQCVAAGVAIFVKQAVDTWTPDQQPMPEGIYAGVGSKRKGGGVIELPYLDGVQHAQFPEVARG